MGESAWGRENRRGGRERHGRGENKRERVLHGKCGTAFRTFTHILPQGKFHFTENVSFVLTNSSILQWCVVAVSTDVLIERKREGCFVQVN